MLTQIIGAVQEYATPVFRAGSVLTLLELFIPQDRYPLSTRLRALLFRSLYILITASTLTISIR